jgi:acetylornithine deacetylase
MASPDLRQMLAALVATPSVSCTDPRLDQGNRAVIDQLATWLADLGFACEIQEVSPGKANLIATLGSGPGGLVLAGHTDTVPWDQGRWQFDPFALTEANGRLYGLGTADMKGFFPLAIEAARDFLHRDLKAPLILLATCDEECSMAGARALVAAGKPAARFAVIGEPTSLRPLRMHKGVMMERVVIEGRSGHSSDPGLGANALEAMNDVMNTLLAYRGELQAAYRNTAFTVPVPTLNLGCIHGGDNPNRICPHCELQFDLRPLPGMNMDELRHEIRRRVAPIAERHAVTAMVEPIYAGTPAMETPADSALVRAAERLTGHRAEAAAFGTEAPFFRQLGMDALIFGPGGIEQAHQPDEFIALDSIRPTVEVLKGLIREFCL